MACEECEHQVQFVVLRQADNDIRLGNALLCEKVDVRAVTADRKPCRQLFCKQFAALTIPVDHLYLHTLPLEKESEPTPRSSCADDGDTFQFVRVARYEALAELLDAVG